MQEGRHDMEPESESDEESPPLPQSLIPRWLAAVVLVLLLASAAATTWLILTG